MRALLSGLLIVGTCGWAAAGENSDLDFIPKTIAQPSEAGPKADRSLGIHKIMIEQSATTWSNRDSLAVKVPQNLPNYQTLSSLDLRSSFKPWGLLDLHLSDRFTYLDQDDISKPNQANYRNDLREAYVSLQVSPKLFIEAGRVNLRKGVSLGYNPTDFFKSRTAVVQSSLDPSAARENRLGVLMAHAQGIFEHASVSLAFAPAVSSPASQASGAATTFDPRLDLTNGTARGLATFSYDLLDLSPQLLVFAGDDGNHLGLNLSQTIGSSIVSYLEWTGVQQEPLPTRAVNFGKRSGTLPAAAPFAPLSSRSMEFQNDVSAGFSWTSSAKYTLHLEYHYHQSGLTRAEFERWISRGQALPALAGELWYTRQFAIEQGEPFVQDEIFLRLELPDFIVARHTLSALSFVNPYDGSALAQLTSQFLASDHWTLAGYLTALFGDKTSERGSLPYAHSASAKASYYF